MKENTGEKSGQNANPLAQFVREHSIAGDGQRLGQRFVNLFIKHPWPELFYENSDKKSLKIINQWLTHHQYYDMLPPLAKER